MTDSYTAEVTGSQDPDDARKWRFVRPTEVPWNDFSFRIKPIAGQSIRIREWLEVQFTLATSNPDSMLWFNRYFNEAFIGHFQVTRLNANDADTGLITERGQIIGNSLNTTTFKWQFQREYDLNLFLRSDDLRPAFLGVVYNCNADLAPGAVENRSINSNNVDKYVRLAYALATKDLPNAATLLDALTQPVIAGYKFADEALFSTLNQIAAIDLTDFTFASRLGDVNLWVHPDWTVDPTSFYSAQIINFSPLALSPNQIPESIACRYPGTLDFP